LNYLFAAYQPICGTGLRVVKRICIADNFRQAIRALTGFAIE